MCSTISDFVYPFWHEFIICLFNELGGQSESRQRPGSRVEEVAWSVSDLCTQRGDKRR